VRIQQLLVANDRSTKCKSIDGAARRHKPLSISVGHTHTDAATEAIIDPLNHLLRITRHHDAGRKYTVTYKFGAEPSVRPPGVLCPSLGRLVGLNICS